VCVCVCVRPWRNVGWGSSLSLCVCVCVQLSILREADMYHTWGPFMNKSAIVKETGKMVGQSHAWPSHLDAIV
jgi:hypothetical protein